MEDNLDPTLRHLYQILKICKQTEALNKDPREKQIGDRVIVWDASFSIEKDGTRHFIGPELKKVAIVVETGCKYIIELKNETRNLDLVVHLTEHDVLMRTSSNYVKLEDHPSLVE